MEEPTQMRSVRRPILVALALFFIIAGSFGLRAQTNPPDDLDAYVAKAMKEFEVPGAAIAIVKDGQVVLAKGYGVRRLGDPATVDARTVFQIASNTKAFTAAALAILVDEGKLRWDDLVINHLPWFQLYDPYVTRELTVTDLLTHRSGLGLGAGDLLWFHSDYGREEILKRLRYIKPASSFRSRYAYDNVLYIAAGQIIPAATGKSWDDFVKERIFTPLGMTSTNTSIRLFHPGDNVASPHMKLDGTMQVALPDTVENAAPAGAINSNATDLANWVRVQLDSGRIDAGKRLFSANRAREMWAPQTILPIGTPPPSLAGLSPNFSLYARGWMLREYKGRKIVTHSGGLTGMTSRVLLVPEMKLGIVVLTNAGTPLFEALTYRILDHHLGVAPTDWAAVLAAFSRQADSSAAAVELTRAEGRAVDSKPSLPLEKYAGRYNDAWYGDATINLENGKLVFRLSRSPEFVGDLEHYQYDTFKARWRSRNLEDAFVYFALKPNGSIDTMKMAAVSPLADFSFDYQDLLFTPVPEQPRK